MVTKISPDWETMCKIMGTDDPNEMQLELRNSIVQEFTKRYLKSIVAEEIFQKCIDQTNGIIRKEYADKIKNYVEQTDAKLKGPFGFNSDMVILTPQVIKAIENNFVNKLNEKIIYAINEKFSDEKIDELINKHIDSSVHWSEQIITSAVKDKYKKIVDSIINKL